MAMSGRGILNWRLLAVLPLLLLFSSSAFGADSLLRYEQRVKRAAEQVQRIQAESDYADEGIDTIKTLLPAREEVEFPGQTVTVDNTWLHTLLDSYQRKGARHDSVSKLQEARGRLNALDGHLVALENQLDRSGKTLAESRSDLRNILSESEFAQKRDDPLAKFIRDAREKILGFIGRVLNAIFSRIFGSRGEGGWVFKGLIILILAAVLLFVVRTLIQLRGRPKKKKKTVTILGEEVDEGTTSSDLAGAALSAARNGEFRTAVRKLYIALLYGLAEKHVIELEANATNHEYMSYVLRYPLLAPSMHYMTDRFDYCWYGMIPVSREEFDAYFARYNEATKSLNALNAVSAASRS